MDVALAVDLVLGAAHDTYDFAIIVGGDGDHRYAVQIASTMKPVLVVLVESQQASWVRRMASTEKDLHAKGLGVYYREFSGTELMDLGVCASGEFEPPPIKKP